MSENSIGKPQETKVSPKEIIFKYLIFLPLFVLTLALSTSIAYIYLRYKVPMYNSGLMLLIKNDSRSPGTDIVADNLGLGSKKANLANETEILKSASLMAKVVDTLDLNLQYFSTGQVKRTEMYRTSPFSYTNLNPLDPVEPFTLTINFDQSKNFQIKELPGKVFRSGQVIRNATMNFRIDVTNPYGIYLENTYFINWRPVYDVALELSYSIVTKQISREASILRLFIQTEVPQKGRDILNQLVYEYNRSTIEDKNRIVDNTLKFVDERLYLLTNELGKVEQGLQNFRQEKEVIDIEMQGTSKYGEVVATQQKLDEQEINLRMIGMLRDHVSKSPDKALPGVSSLGVQDPTLSSLIQQYTQTQLEREEKSKTIPNANPIMQGLNGRVEKLRSSILENLKNLQASANNIRNRTRQELGSLKGTMRQIPAQEKELLEIKRQQGIKENLFLFLLQKREEAAITRASAVASSYALDPAITNYAPVSPDKTAIYRIAIILGLLIPIGIIYLRDLLKDKIVTRQDIAKLTSVPIIGEVAHHPEKNRQWVVGVQDRSILSEQFRIIRTNLQYFVANKHNPVILITSSIAGEGKTFTSMNIGAVWSIANKRTVILELDLRKPKISSSLNLENHKGITNYMLGQVPMEQLPVPVQGMDNLFVIPAGPIPPNPSELLMDNKIDELFHYLRSNFDFIVIDSAPVGLVSDTKILSRFADATLYIVRQRYTLKKQLNAIEEMYRDKTLPSMGLLVNDVKLGGISSYYGYGYGYGYNYNNYSYNYGNESKPTWWKRLINYYK